MKGFIKWTIVVIILVAAIIFAIHFVEDEFDKHTQEDIKTEMLQVQGKAKIVLERYRVDNNNGLKGEKMEDLSLEEAFGITEVTNFYKWSDEVLKEEGITQPILNSDEYYLVNYDTEEVVYSAGYKAEDGKIYYKLSDIKNIDIQNEETHEKGEEENDGKGESQAQ